MILKLYKTDDDYNVINKTLTDEVTLTINFRKDFNILAPEIYLLPEQDLEYLDYNYCYIQELDRYYYINSIEMANASLYRLNCRCDYLETHKAQLLDSTARFRRNLKVGDYQNLNLTELATKGVTIFKSNKGFEGDSTLILTTVGGGTDDN